MAALDAFAMIDGVNYLHPQPQKERPTIPVRLAWRRYLEETRSASFEAYDLVEQLAWQRLARDLTNLGGPLDLRGEQFVRAAPVKHHPPTGVWG